VGERIRVALADPANQLEIVAVIGHAKTIAGLVALISRVRTRRVLR
jgi:hypothetical protein